MNWRNSLSRALAVAITLVAACVCRAAAADDRLSTANQDHLWFVLKAPPAPGKPDGFNLCHHATDLGGPYYEPQAWLSKTPQAMASWGDRIWVVFPPRTGGEGGAVSDTRREVFTIQVLKNAALGVYVSSPADRMDLAPSLPGDGDLVGFAGTASGPVALVLPDQSSPNTGTQPQADIAQSRQPKLLALRYDKWVELPLPADFSLTGKAALAAGGADGNQINLFTTKAGTTVGSIRYVRSASGDWERSELPFDLASVMSGGSGGNGGVSRFVNAMGQVAAIVERDGSCEISYLRDKHLAFLTQFPKPSGPWTIVGFNHGLSLIEYQSDGAVSIRPIDPLTGELASPSILTGQPLTAGKLWQVSMLIAMSVSILLLVFLIRPVSRKPVTLPAGLAPLPIGLRAIALLIDLVPAGVVVGLFLRAPIQEMFAVPVTTIDLDRSVPYLIMAGLTVVHSTIGEMLKSTTLGKSFVGARVVTVDGLRPRRAQILMRNGLKCLILIVPPLAVFALINPHLQGLPDMASGTVVVHESEPVAQE